MLIPFLLAIAPGCATSLVNSPSGDSFTTSTNGPGSVPFRNARSKTVEYFGPGRELIPPKDLAEIRIGWFAPYDPDDPIGGAMWQAATLAVESANAAGGYRGTDYQLVPYWSTNPWGTGIKGVTQMAYADRVWAIVGAPDGPSAHLVEQVVAKARLLFVSPISTDKTANLINVPWIFSCAPGDHLLAPLLANAIASETQGGTFALVSCTDHDSRLFSAELRSALKELSLFASCDLEFQPDTHDFGHQLAVLRDLQPKTIALIAGPKEAADFLIAMRGAELTSAVFGGPAMGRRSFLDRAGPLSEGVVFPLLWCPSASGLRANEFAARFRERFGAEPDYTAAYTFDAMRILFAAIDQAGLNRTLIRAALRDLSPWTGVTGTINWDATGHNRKTVPLGTIQNGRLLPR